MSNVWFTSDWHLGHKNIQKFRKEVESTEHNTQVIAEDMYKYVRKRDIVWCLGDSIFEESLVPIVRYWPGKKFLVRGNHCKLSTKTYLEIFQEIYGLKRYKNFWLCHCPIISEELYSKFCLHGHLHYNTVDDPRYLNVCVEWCQKLVGRSLISLNEIKDIFNSRKHDIEEMEK